MMSIARDIDNRRGLAVVDPFSFPLPQSSLDVIPIQFWGGVQAKYWPEPHGWHAFVDDRGWHAYSTERIIAADSHECSDTDMKCYLLRFAYPGQDPRRPVRDSDVNSVRDPRWFGRFLPGGIVKTMVSPDGLTIVNHTQPGHVFHDGILIRTMKRVNKKWYMKTIGLGRNERWGIFSAGIMARINQAQGPSLFNRVDELMSEFIVQDKAEYLIHRNAALTIQRWWRHMRRNLLQRGGQ